MPDLAPGPGRALHPAGLCEPAALVAAQDPGPAVAAATARQGPKAGVRRQHRGERTGCDRDRRVHQVPVGRAGGRAVRGHPDGEVRPTPRTRVGGTAHGGVHRRGTSRGDGCLGVGQEATAVDGDPAPPESQRTALSLPAPVHRVRRNLVTVGEAEVVGVVAGQLGRTTLSPADPVLTERADRAFAVRPSSVAVAPCHDHRSHCHDAMWAFRPRRHTCLLHRRGRLAQQAPTLPAASASSRRRPKEGIRETDHGRARRWPPA
mgnify:CR=1 FL=1